MTDSNGNSGSLGGLVLGAGFSMMLLAPFYVGYRYGVHVLAFIGAAFSTLLAIFSPSLVAMANDIGDCGHGCLAAPAARMILLLDGLWWWWSTGLMWLVAILAVVANVTRPQAAEHQAN